MKTYFTYLDLVGFFKNYPETTENLKSLRLECRFAPSLHELLNLVAWAYTPQGDEYWVGIYWKLVANHQVKVLP